MGSNSLARPHRGDERLRSRFDVTSHGPLGPLGIVRRERGFRDDAARKTLINLFNLLGSDSALVREYRSRLAAALN